MSPARGLPRLAAPIVFAVALVAEPAVAEPPPSTTPAAPAATSAAVLPPKLLSDSTVNYPEGATGDATVVLLLTINPDGTVRQASAEKTEEPFSSQAVGAALGWRFNPAMRNGAPVAAKIRFEVVFHAPVAAVPDTSDVPNPYSEPEPKEKAAPLPAVQEVIIRGARPEPSRSATLSRAEVRQIPGTFGDPFRAIEVMPGVTPIISGLPFFFVRGAPPGDVGYFLDGIRVPLLFHVGVGPSVIHPALMDRVDLYPGGYPARFGRLSGGIVAGETIAPRPETHGEYNARLFDAGALAETSFDNQRGTVLLGGRYSYTAGLLSLLQSTTQLDYWDYQARATYDLTRDEQIGVFAFGSYDFLGQKTSDGGTVTLFGTEFHRVDLRYDRKLDEDGSVRLAVTGGFDRSRLPQDRFLRDRLGGVRGEIAYRLGPGALLRAGTDVQLDSYDIQLNAGDVGPQVAQAAALFPSRTDLSSAARADVVLKVDPKLEVTPGVRLDLYASEGATATSIDPRLATRLEVTDRLRLLSAMGFAHQPPAFVVPLPGFQPSLKGGLQEAVQESMGFELDLGDATTATATVFHNGFFNLSDPLGTTPPRVSGCPPGTFPSDEVVGDRGGQVGNPSCSKDNFPKPDRVGTDRSGGATQGAGASGANQGASQIEARTTGTAYGLELFLKRKLTSRLGGFLSYTLSRSTRSYGDRVYVASFDRTHVANAALAYNLGRNWRAGTRLVFYTGLPKAPDPTDPTSTRLPPFYRVDLRLEKRWELGKKSWISFVAEWMNATLSKEAISTSCNLQGCQSQEIGPVTVPSLGVEGGF